MPRQLKMQRRHFRLIASAVSDFLSNGVSTAEQALELSNTFSDHLRGTNPGFSSERFKTACFEGFKPKKPSIKVLP